ncbi:DUF6551 family protein [Streptomyces sp. SKN60]|uniref:DUF6551 family protein n=1 Tax=Streptomyces TaxID=1883 RepID=UPI00224625DD|nr:DUF6551 family protein [Streptomyces sp. SKN60]MCX2185645.1 ParB N-terminal domain-containing protein [Streptomyces sp. SKN60]
MSSVSHTVTYGVQIPVQKLFVDYDVQREPDRRRAKKIAEAFDENKLGSIIVSDRGDGTFHIIDGQHRWLAAKEAEHPYLHADVHTGLERAQEADMFLAKNRDSKKPSAFDEHKNGVAAGHSPYVEAEAVLKKHNLTAGSSSANQFGAITKAHALVKQFGPDVLDRALTVAENAWGRSRFTWEGVIIHGLGLIIGRHPELIDDKRMAQRLASTSTAEGMKGRITTAATGGGTRHDGTGGRATAAYWVMVTVWDTGLPKTSAKRIRKAEEF